MIETWAIIPSRDRIDLLTALVTTLVRQNSHVVVVDNGYDPPLCQRSSIGSLIDVVAHDDEQPPNLSKMWNIGRDEITRVRARRGDASTPFNLAFFNDDVVLPNTWVAAVGDALRSHDVVAACSDAYGTLRDPLLKREPDRSLGTRMCPWAFMLRGEVDLRADEDMRWWWSDTDVDFRARQAGGLVIIPGHRAVNTRANSTTVGALAAQAGRDGETFSRKWGFKPW